MSPFERASKLYDDHPQAQTFSWYLNWHALHGFVFITPDFFVMGRPVIRAADHENITEPTHLFTHEDCDCWYIHCLAGDMGKSWRVLPWELPWFAFERFRHGKLELCFVPTESMKRHIPPKP